MNNLEIEQTALLNKMLEADGLTLHPILRKTLELIPHLC